jgi:hypothetical protein
MPARDLLRVSLLALVFGLSCGGGDGAPCQTLTRRLCELSCACRPVKTDTSRCYLQDTSRTSGRNPLPCADSLARDVCGDTTKPPSLFEACLAAVDKAQCVPETDRSPLRLPAECAGLLDCKAGPCLN